MTEQPKIATRDELERMVEEADTGGRKPVGVVGRLVFVICLAWALFQLWYASPLPFALSWGVLNDTQARSIHLIFALTLAFITFPAYSRASRRVVPWYDWLLVAASLFATGYLIVNYMALIQRPGLPTTLDLVASVIGIAVLLEGARRAVGPAIAVIALIMIGYIFFGPYMPSLISHKGANLSRAMSQLWLTSEGVFGVALGVSTSVIFLFVLFGNLLEKAGAGSWMIQLAFSLLGQYRGGPAKAAVVASGMTGMISGSSIANVVTTGTFTIPLMKRVGYSAEKAGAIECAAGVNGQLMPPVMGAAAFLIAEYVGITYADVVRHAFVPAFVTYLALFYIVDIEAMKAGMRGLPVSHKQATIVRLMNTLFGFLLIAGLFALVHFGLEPFRHALGRAANWALGALGIGLYLAFLWLRAQHPDPVIDDPDRALVEIPGFWETLRSGLHYLLPIIVLIWCLMLEEMSPGLSGFYGCLALIGLLLTQKPLTALFRGEGTYVARALDGFRDVIDGLIAGARNMTSVGIATATAGIIVGAVSLTGIGLVMTEVVELLSGGYFIGMLLLTAVICIILGMGMPTTAAYVVVATLMAPVAVELAAQNDMAVPLVAVHMFVFYFGLMADVTPPVGLASYAAAAISGGDPVKTGVQSFRYEIRTALLPFLFIFNTELLLIGVQSVGHFLIVLASAILAMMAFVAASQQWFLTKNRLWETVALLLVSFTLFRPGFWLDRIQPPFETLPAYAWTEELGRPASEGFIKLRFMSQDRQGDETEKVIRIALAEGKTTAERLRSVGLTLMGSGDDVRIQQARFGGLANKVGLDAGDRLLNVERPADRMSRYVMFIPALLLLGLIVLAQLRRKPENAPVVPALT
ncbi:MAG: TRAP transporter permease [Proteobacteria bacterium]|nr:TRAP transporter permease [Pseudomonadota bacterium]